MSERKILVPDWSGLLAAESSAGIPCICKPAREYWELPGGKRHSNDRNSKFTVVREFREETGIRLQVSDVVLVGSLQEFNLYDHHEFRMDFFYCTLTDKQLAKRFERSLEGEVVKVISRDELRTMPNFSPYHRMLMEKFGIWKK